MKTEIKNAIEGFKNLKILVVGDAVLDTYIYGSNDRICREAPVPVFNKHEEKFCCGGAANTAINLAALGAVTYFLTVIGKDASGDELEDLLEKNGVHCEYILRDKSRTTIAKKRVVASSNIILRLDEGSITKINGRLETFLVQKFFELEEFVDAIVLSDYGFGVLTDRFISSIKPVTDSYSKPLIVDSKNLSRFSKLHPTAVKPNYEEYLQLMNISEVSKGNRVYHVFNNSDTVLKKTGAENVAVTLDADGVALLRKGKQPWHLSCIPQDAKNTIGAGDSFISALTLGIASQLPVETATEIAAAAAAIVVQKEGTALCSNMQLRSYFNAIPKYISTMEELLNIIKELTEENKKIVFTNGCFDLIHKGHIALLNQARKAGDVLVVGVNDDESVRKVKGNDRPVNSLEDRITVLAGLQSVDYLVSFSEESPLQLIKAVHPDVFIKGGDYNEKSIPEIPLLKKLGCEVKIIPHTYEISTTDLIQRINEIVEETK